MCNCFLNDLYIYFYNSRPVSSNSSNFLISINTCSFELLIECFHYIQMRIMSNLKVKLHWKLLVATILFPIWGNSKAKKILSSNESVIFSTFLQNLLFSGFYSSIHRTFLFSRNITDCVFWFAYITTGNGMVEGPCSVICRNIFELKLGTLEWNN